jgi:hypothetical protein
MVFDFATSGWSPQRAFEMTDTGADRCSGRDINVGCILTVGSAEELQCFLPGFEPPVWLTVEVVDESESQAFRIQAGWPASTFELSGGWVHTNRYYGGVG